MAAWILAWGLLAMPVAQDGVAKGGGAASKVRELAGELGRAGFEVDVEAFKVETLSEDACRADIDAQQDVFFGPGHFGSMWVLYRSLGHDLGGSAEGCRAQVSALLASSLVAYYGFHRDALVLIDSKVGELGRSEQTLIHELAHAWRDQRDELSAFFESGERTFERARIKQCLVEGEAEAIALQVLLARTGEDLAELDGRRLDDSLARMTAGLAVSTLYAVGRTYAIARFREQGKGFYARPFDELPSSTEQIIHGSKLGVDEPAVVTLPDWPEDWEEVELAHEDTIGELGLFGLLTDGGLNELEAWRCAIGWDGDRLRLWNTPEGEPLLMAWSLVFDREQDAQQFHASWSVKSSALSRQDGRRVLTVIGEGERGPAMLELMTAEALPEPGESDAATTAAIEAKMPETSPEAHVADGRWRIPGLRLSIPVPEGWTPQDIQGTPFLLDQRRAGFSDNLNIALIPNPDGASATELLELNRNALDQTAGLRPHSSDVRLVAGMDAVYITYGQTMGGRQLEFRILILPRGDQQVVVTGTILAERSQEVAPIVDRMLLGARFDG